MITGCESPGCLKSFEYLETCENPLYVGVDVARKKHLTVIDVGERIGDVMWDRLRIELRDTPFSEMEHELFRILALPSVKACCIDATGLGMQLAERAEQRAGWKVEKITFSASIKRDMAYALRNACEGRQLRNDISPALRADLRAVRREVTGADTLRIVGESEDGHCDRFWAKALRQHAAKQRREFFATVIE
jgi:phage FluMu gp28-like protein